MRDLTRHPITIREIEAACSRAAMLIEQSESVGDIDPVAIRAAATIARHAGKLLREMERRTLCEPNPTRRYGAPFGEAAALMSCSEWDWRSK